jgi:hypothetical protein
MAAGSSSACSSPVIWNQASPSTPGRHVQPGDAQVRVAQRDGALIALTPELGQRCLQVVVPAVNDGRGREVRVAEGIGDSRAMTGSLWWPASPTSAQPGPDDVRKKVGRAAVPRSDSAMTASPSRPASA